MTKTEPVLKRLVGERGPEKTFQKVQNQKSGNLPKTSAFLCIGSVFYHILEIGTPFWRSSGPLLEPKTH